MMKIGSAWRNKDNPKHYSGPLELGVGRVVMLKRDKKKDTEPDVDIFLDFSPYKPQADKPRSDTNGDAI